MDGSAATKEFLAPGETIKRLRTELGLAQDGLSVRSGVSRATIGSIEVHDHDPSYDTKRRLAKALRKKVSDIWREETDD